MVARQLLVGRDRLLPALLGLVGLGDAEPRGAAELFMRGAVL